jgi:hypothetical protein
LVEVTYLPWKKLIVHEIVEHQNKIFFEWLMGEAVKQNVASPVANWANGVTFALGSFMETPEIIKDKLNGIIHYAVVNFTKMGYQAEFPVEVQGQRYSIKIMQSDNPDFLDLTAFLKTWEKTKPNKPKS